MKNEKSKQLQEPQDKNKEQNVLRIEVIKEFFENISSTSFTFIIILATFALVVVDYYNLPTKFIYEYHKFFSMFVFVAFIFLIVWVLESGFLKSIKIPALSQFDYTLFLISVTSFSYILAKCYMFGFSLWIFAPLIIFAVCSLTLLHRLNIRTKALSEYNSRNTNVYSLKELLEGKCLSVDGSPILLEEKAVDYDLADREEIIEKLYQTILHCNPKESYVIALEGNWGTGKTTILNNVKRRIEAPENGNDEIKIINDFDPWIYGGQEAMLSALFNKLMVEIGVSPKSVANKKMLSEIIETMIGELPDKYHVGSLLKGARSVCSGAQYNSSLKARLCSYLKTTNKKFVFFIDNLDRANEENIVLLFKMIGTIFDLPGVVYVLSYEKDRVESALKETKNIDPRYTEKIIQQTITVPEVMTDGFEKMYIPAIDTLLATYKIRTEELPALPKIEDYICSKCSNIREFIRMINTAFTTVFSAKTELNIQDLFIIELVHFYEPDLYIKIFNNRRFFIEQGDDRVVIERFLIDKNYIDNAENLFHNIQVENPNACKLLEEVFPLFKLYYSEGDLKGVDKSRFSDDNEANKKHRIYDGRYFDMYFSYSPTSYARLYNNVIEFLYEVSSIPDSQIVQNKLEDCISDMAYSDQIKWFAIMDMNLDKMKTKNLLYITIAIFNLLHKKDDTNQAIIESDSKPTAYIASALLHCDECTVKEFYNSIKGKNIYIDTIGAIYHYALKEKQSTENAERIISIMQTQYSEQCEPILKEKIDIFEGERYHYGNSIGLYRYCRENEKMDEFSEYISAVQTSGNIYRILLDTCARSRNMEENHWTWFIEDEKFKGYFRTKDTADKCILNHKQTSDEQFIKELYDLYSTGEKDFFGEAMGKKLPANKIPTV